MLERNAVGLVAKAIGLLIGVSPVLVAQQADPCPDERSHQFDFWLGEWEVYAQDNLAGTNSIQPILDGCVLQESWRAVRGSAGSSFNFFNPQLEKWQQFWVWRNGTTLELQGAYSEGKMILAGESLDREGKRVHHRITWYDNPGNTVRQHWETSEDGGATWQSTFDGLYRRKE
jgi:hypothetical protein